MAVSASTSIRTVSLGWAGGSLQTFKNRQSTGAGIAYDLRAGYSNFAVSAIGASTKGTVTLQGSEDGNTWFTMKAGVKSAAAPTPTASTTTFPVQFVRGVMTSTSTAVTNVHITVN